MHRLGDRNAHYWLALRMAKATDTDLARAFDEYSLDSGDWAGMVERCRACDWVGGCRRWLADPEGEQHRDVPPTCANQDRFAALLAKLTSDTTD